ncbi:MAG: thrombospondin type 3 repeat-containing protein [Candidatus Hodarchaeota archaeon]
MRVGYHNYSFLVLDEMDNIYTFTAQPTLTLRQWDEEGNLIGLIQLGENKSARFHMEMGIADTTGNILIIGGYRPPGGYFRLNLLVFSADSDTDKLSDWMENYFGTDSSTPDTDQDGIPDSWEYCMKLNGTNPNDAWQDSDGDWVPNIIEYLGGSNPHLVLSFPLLSLSYFHALALIGPGIIYGIFFVRKRKPKKEKLFFALLTLLLLIYLVVIALPFAFFSAINASVNWCSS